MSTERIESASHDSYEAYNNTAVEPISQPVADEVPPGGSSEMGTDGEPSSADSPVASNYTLQTGLDPELERVLIQRNAFSAEAEDSAAPSLTSATDEPVPTTSSANGSNTGVEPFWSKEEYERRAQADPSLRLPEWTANDSQANAASVANWLEGKPPELQAQMLHRLLEDGMPERGWPTGHHDFLSGAAQLPQEQRGVITNAFSNAYNLHPTEFSAQLSGLSATLNSRTTAPTPEANGMAQLVRLTGNATLIQDYARTMLSAAANRPVNGYLAGTALLGLNPSDLRAFLNNNQDKIPTLVDSLTTGSRRTGVDASQTVQILLQRAGQGRDGDPTQGELKLFEATLNNSHTNRNLAAAARDFVNANPDAALDHLRQQPGGADGNFLSARHVERLTSIGVFPKLDGTSARYGPDIASWLQGQPSALQAEFMHHMMNDKEGIAILKVWTAGLDDNGRQAYADALNAAYQRDPNATINQINNVGDSYFGAIDQGGYGFSQVIAQTRNPDLISDYAAHRMEVARSLPAQAPARISAELDALRATGSNPQLLREVLPQLSREDVQRISRQEPELTAQLLEAASRITYMGPDHEGHLAPEAMRFFADVVSTPTDNVALKEAAGAFFAENAEDLVRAFGTYSQGGGSFGPGTEYGPRALENFFSHVLFADGADELQYTDPFGNRSSLVEQIVGSKDANGRVIEGTGVFGRVTQSFLREAQEIDQLKDRGQISADRADRALRNIGYGLGSLIGAMEAGLAQTSHDDRETRENAAKAFGVAAGVAAATIIATAGGPITLTVAGAVVTLDGVDNAVSFFTEEGLKAVNARGGDRYAAFDSLYGNFGRVINNFGAARDIGPALDSGYSDGRNDYLLTRLAQILR